MSNEEPIAPEQAAPKRFQFVYFSITATWKVRDRQHPFGVEKTKTLPRMPAVDFMDAIRKAQAKFPGATISLKSVQSKEASRN